LPRTGHTGEVGGGREGAPIDVVNCK
jgi:hypothetical protein